MNSIESDNYWKCVKSIASEASDFLYADKERFIDESVSGSEYTTYTRQIFVCLSCSKNIGAYNRDSSFQDLAYYSGSFSVLSSKVAYYAMLADVWGEVTRKGEDDGEEEDDGV
jgi:hypothetical protein